MIYPLNLDMIYPFKMCVILSRISQNGKWVILNKMERVYKCTINMLSNGIV